VKTEPARAAVHLGTRIDEPIRLEHSSPTVPASSADAPVTSVSVPSPRISWRVSSAQSGRRQLGSEIEVESAARSIRVAPVMGAVLTSAELRFDSPYGRIRSSWRLVGSRFELEVTIPVGVTANIELVDGTTIPDVEHGHYSFTAMVPPTRLPEDLK
jgi:hypothetical protein